MISELAGIIIMLSRTVKIATHIDCAIFCCCSSSSSSFLINVSNKNCDRLTMSLIRFLFDWSTFHCCTIVCTSAWIPKKKEEGFFLLLLKLSDCQAVASIGLTVTPTWNEQLNNRATIRCSYIYAWRMKRIINKIHFPLHCQFHIWGPLSTCYTHTQTQRICEHNFDRRSQLIELNWTLSTLSW